ncbi:hypothetical protein GCM10027431_15000 [Lysobacter rhizosphaerae]
MSDSAKSKEGNPVFSFLKGGYDAIASKEGIDFDWERAAGRVREQMNDAMNARHLSFLLGSGCSSFYKNGQQVGVPTMGPLASAFIGNIGSPGDANYVTQTERDLLREKLGLDIGEAEYSRNLERLMEALFSFQFIVNRSSQPEIKAAATVVKDVIDKVTRHILRACLAGEFVVDDSVIELYQSFYRKLVYRDRTLPRPWIFTTNYDLFNETAMDLVGTPYTNGFAGVVQRRFNPATFRYSLGEQLDLSRQRWTSVDNYIYLCKLHGSVSWTEDGKTLFPIREVPDPKPSTTNRVMIYPTPAKQSASFGSPYSDLFREFQSHIVREQSVLIVLGYSFGDEHVNNIIFQALTIPSFRMIAFLPPDLMGVAQTLRELEDPRIWIIGGEGPLPGQKAHYFDTFVEKFMPELPGNKVDSAVAKVLERLLTKTSEGSTETDQDDD